MQVFMNEQEIIQCLTRLGEELEPFHFEQPLRILMIGGAFMITQIGNREKTEDVDVLAYIDRHISKRALEVYAPDIRKTFKALSDVFSFK